MTQSTMKHYPNPKKLRETSILKGASTANAELQDAMIFSARNKIMANLQSLEESGRLDVTSYGQRWISDNVNQLAAHILRTPPNEVIMSFIEFPKKLSFNGESVSCQQYFDNVSSYKAKGIRYKKGGDEDINDFISGCHKSRKRSQTVSLIVLSQILQKVVGCKLSKSEIDDIMISNKSRSLSSVAGHIMEDVLVQLVAGKTKSLLPLIPSQSISFLTDVKRNKFVTKAGKATKKGTSVAKVLGLKNIKSIENIALIKAGHKLLQLVSDNLSDIMIFNGEISIVKEVMDQMEDCRNYTLTSASELRPVLEMPVTNGKSTSYLNYPLKSNLLHADDRSLHLSEIDVDAAQRIQSVPFKINKKYLAAVEAASEAGLVIKDKLNVVVPEPLPRPDNFPVFDRSKTKEEFRQEKEDWFSVQENKEAYWKWKDKANLREKQIAKAISINDMNKRVLDIARYYADYGGAFYLPVYFDYRTRCYYCPTILNPQSSKMAKAMFVAAEAEEITEEGMEYWLVNFANSMKKVKSPIGEIFAGDKSPWEVAIHAAKNELSKGAAVASDPIATFDHWSSQDDPFGYLAQCFECSKVIESGPDAKSNLFLNMDGSCNGYQHAGGYLQDHATATLVNMTLYSDKTCPQDLYGEVAKYMVAQAKNRRSTLDQKFLNNDVITRKAVKRIVMCIGYSLTEGGALTYSDEEIINLTDDIGWNPLYNTKEELIECSTYLRDGIFGAIKEVAPAIFRTRDAIKETGKLICDLGDGIVRMNTMTGTELSFTKHPEKKDRICLSFNGKVSHFTVKEKDFDRIEATEVANASSPNFTHMNDATHLRLVALAMPEEAPLLFIHDSFATIAKYASKMAYHTRKEFRNMYENSDPLKDFVKKNLTNIGLQYNVDVNEILSADEDADLEQFKGVKRKLVKGLNKIRRNINQTKDLDWDLLMQNRNFFR